MSDSRAALLAAAAEEFAQFGVKGARIRAIVERAGVNERMIYHHFGNKEGLYGAVMDDQRLTLASAWLPVLEQAVDLEPVEGMRLVLAGFLRIVSGRRQTMALSFQEWLAEWNHRGIQPTLDNLPGQVREVYERGQREGVFRPDIPFVVAYGTAIGSLMAMAAFGPRFIEWLSPSLSSDSEEVQAQIVDQILNGLTARTVREPTST